jgi:predicted HTH domain antitoxin
MKPILGARMKTLTASKKKKAAAKPRLGNAQADALLKARLFMNAEAAQRQAKSMWLAVNPELRLEAAIELFRSDEVTFERAAEIAGLNRWIFHEILIKRDIKIVIEADPVEELDKAVEAIRKHMQ